MLSKKVGINITYFVFLFIGLAFLHVYHALLIASGSTLESIYFVIQAIGQSFLEVFAFMILAYMLPRSFLPWCIAFTAFLFVARLLDLPLVRLLGLSFWDATAFVSKEQIRNFIEQIYASNVSIGIWITGGLVGFALIEAGVLAFHLTDLYAKKITRTIRSLLYSFGCCCLFFLALEMGGLFVVRGAVYEEYVHAMPWKRGMLQRDGALITLPFSLRQAEIPETVSAAPLSKKPDIYLFIAESLREDFITKETAPNLVKFRKENIALDLTLSNANATQLSWFTIFHSRFPIYWGSTIPYGALPIKILKQMGYKIHVYTSARLSFFKMDEIIFGEATQYAESIYTFFNDEKEPPCERDERAINQLCEDMQKGDGGRVFIVFLDGTHFDYSWPSENTRFTPFEEQVNFVKFAFIKGDLEPLKNRYRNSIAFMDTLFGRVMDNLKGKDESIVVFTGDHGEEFYESGRLFHASALSMEQTRVPLYYKMGKKPKAKMTSHIDIFPSILHYLSGDERYKTFFDGQSIFSESRWPFLVTARYNTGRTPYEFMLHNGRCKLLARFSNEGEIFKSDAIRVLSLQNVEEKYIAQEFGEAFDLLFSTR